MLFKFGDFDLTPHMVEKGFKIRPNARQDLDSYTDATGETHRNALKHTKTIVTASIMPMSKEEKVLFMQGITSNYINPLERDAICTYYDEEYDVEKTGHFYLDPNFEIVISKEGKEKKYEEFNMTFTEY